MKVEVINTGTELLLGNVINTHLAFFAKELFTLGLRIERQVTVPDGDAIRAVLEDSFTRADVILVTGGLGPTTDDVTREIVARLLNLPMAEDPEVLAAIEARFARRNLTITERVKRQAQVPRGAMVLRNDNGTAPGLYFAKTGSSPALFLLPGPPRELKPMFTDLVLPLLRALLPAGDIPECRNFRIIGTGESGVEAAVGAQLLAIEGLELGYCAHVGSVDVRCIGTPEMIQKAEVIIRRELGEWLASEDLSSLEEIVVQLLTSRGEELALAESCTGGFVSHQITNVPGSSVVFMEGFVTYANRAKARALGVQEGLIADCGAVSAEVAVAMADGALQLSGATHALSLTGIAGPGGGSAGKPVGTVHIALASKGLATVTEEHHFPSGRATFKVLAAQAALNMLRRRLRDS